MAAASHEAYFGRDIARNLVLHVERVVLHGSILELLVHRKDAIRWRRQLGISKYRLARHDGVVRCSGGEDGAWTGGVVDNAGGSAVRRAIVAKSVQVRRVVVDAVIATDHELVGIAGRVGEPDARCEVILTGRVDRID